MKVNLWEDDIAMWAVCEATGNQYDLVDKMKVDENGLRDVVFSVGGIELDFLKVIHRMQDIFKDSVNKKAQELLSRKYQTLIDEVIDIQERIESQTERFKYDWEE